MSLPQSQIRYTEDEYLAIERESEWMGGAARLR